MRRNCWQYPNGRRRSAAGKVNENASFTEALKNLEKMYLNLIENGWKLNDIDTMDIGFFFDLMEKDDTKHKEDERMSAIDFFNSI